MLWSESACTFTRDPFPSASVDGNDLFVLLYCTPADWGMPRGVEAVVVQSTQGNRSHSQIEFSGKSTRSPSSENLEMFCVIWQTEQTWAQTFQRWLNLIDDISFGTSLQLNHFASSAVHVINRNVKGRWRTTYPGHGGPCDVQRADCGS